MPVALTLNAAGWLMVTEVLLGCSEKTGTTGVGETVSVKFWVAAGLTPLAAWSTKLKGDPTVLAGVPLITPVLVLSDAHAGNEPEATE